MTLLPAARMAFALGALTALPQPALADDDAQVWTSMSVSGQIRGDLAGYADVNARFVDNASLVGHFQVRGGLGWRISPGFIIGAGYSYVRTESTSGQVAHENRIFQQASYPFGKLGNVSITGRTRLEQRFFDGQDETVHRFRQQVRLTIPLKSPEGLRAIAHTEAFFLLNEVLGVPTGLNQMRSFIGLGIPLKGKTALEAGYMNQSVFPGEDRYNHILSLSLTTGF